LINQVHSKLEKFDLKNISPSDRSPLAAECYNTRLNIIKNWNRCFQQERLHIKMPYEGTVPLDPHFSDQLANGR